MKPLMLARAVVNVEDRVAKLERHVDHQHTTIGALTRLVETLAERQQGDEGMIVDIKTLISKINDETNAVAAEVADLKSKIPTDGEVLDTATATDLQNQLQSISDRLTGIGANPTQPIPSDPTVTVGG
jgi:uncharacterized coiled-coil protein SlyX